MTFVCGAVRLPDDIPDAGGGVCCQGAALDGPTGCGCWTAVYDLEQARHSRRHRSARRPPTRPLPGLRLQRRQPRTVGRRPLPRLRARRTRRSRADRHALLLPPRHPPPRPNAATRLDLSNINRPLFSIDEDRPRRYIALSWGNGNSDPVLLIELRRRA